MKRGTLYSFLIIAMIAFGCENGDANAEASITGGTGTGGSLASFLVTGDNLYVVTGSDLKSFNLTDGDGIEHRGTLTLDSFLETLFLYESRLLIGSNDAVYFVDINDPDSPRLISEYQHFTSCDPVVARGNIAYSTLRTTGCRWAGQELLDVIDISDLNNPRTIASYGVNTPYGLTVTQDYLLVCENGGISVINNSDPANLQWLERFTFESGAVPFDIINTGDVMIVTTDSGIFNIELSENGTLTVLGEITAD